MIIMHAVSQDPTTLINLSTLGTKPWSRWFVLSVVTVPK